MIRRDSRKDAGRVARLATLPLSSTNTLTARAIPQPYASLIVRGIKDVGNHPVTFRPRSATALTVEWAARLHRVPLVEFLDILNTAVAGRQPGDKA